MSFAIAAVVSAGLMLSYGAMVGYAEHKGWPAPSLWPVMLLFFGCLFVYDTIAECINIRRRFRGQDEIRTLRGDQ